MRQKSNLVFNLAGATEFSILDFCKVAIDTINPAIPLEVGSSLRDFSPIARGSADISRLKSLGWESKVNLADGLKRTFESVVWRIQRGL